MATTMDRNLVLLLSSGHTVKIALKPDDLSDGLPTTQSVGEFLDGLNAVAISPAREQQARTHSGNHLFGLEFDVDRIVMAYVESMEQATADADPNDLQRIDAYSPGEAL